ncbi:protein-tyrosine-phosphatase PTP1-like [Hibiscus syriacus]|uniref:Protein-tyrosine-phosphatase PTP1-like n=1 Tax=Hibiscus syriacus TaxID=106335 RepID=A0A6A3B212_HIBSY|nr:protein PSK SIMULATOR 1-like isoform X2 [Hibiscus syriacus]KAE8709918.1 protein-tyrosine-phosphatase PTP1-like [Hibiscus syriacus]
MGGLCSRRSTVDDVPSGGFPHVNGHFGRGSGLDFQTRELPAKINVKSTPPAIEDSVDKESGEPFSFPEVNAAPYGTSADDINDGTPRLSGALSDKSRSTKSKQATVAKVSEVSSLLGRAGTVGLGKAVEVLDTLGSSMTNLNLSSGFTFGVTTKGTKISILAFEVANTIVKGGNLVQSLSEENIRHLKEVVLPSEGVQNLILRDMDELLRIAAADKREELKVFSGEVVRFGNRCKDPQWHNLDRYFEKLGFELTLEKQLKDEAETIMKQLMSLVQYTAELYHELHALDRFEQDYRRKLQEEDNSTAAQRGDNLSILRAELKSQKKHVRSLKKKSLWSKILEEVMEKLVDVVHFLHLEIHEAFVSTGGEKPVKGSVNSHKKLGSVGLALHYANIITQIDTLVSRSSSVPPNTRDSLYQGLPPTVKSALRFRLQTFQIKEELTVPQIKAEMEKTLQWLVPVATNTTKAHHGFGWVGEWANTGSEVNHKPAGQKGLLRIETLHHADKEKTEVYILDLVVWLHHLVIQVRACNGGIRSPVKSPIRSPNQKMVQLSTQKPASPMLTVEDQEMLRDVSKRKNTPGISKSQEFDTAKTRLSKNHRLSKSSSHTPTIETKKDSFPIRRLSSVPFINFDIDWMKALDVIDRVDTL